VYSNVGQVATPAWPAAPDGPSEISVDYDEIVLTCPAYAEGITYHLEYSLDGEDWHVLGDFPSWYYYQHEGLTDGTVYQYRESAVNVDGESAYSDIVRIQTPPAAPYNLAAERIGANDIKLTWECDSQRVEQFVIEQQLHVDPGHATIGWVDGSQREFIASGPFVVGTDQGFWVQSYIAPGIRSGWDAPHVFVYIRPRLDTPAGLRATAVSMTGVALEWEAVDGEGLTYVLQKKRGDESWTTVYTGSDTSTSDSFAEAEGLTIQYRVDVHTSETPYN
jgi:hypothetical protein